MRHDRNELSIRRTSHCDPLGHPAIRMELFGGDQPIMQYFASSLGDAIRYEQETLQNLRDRKCAMPIVLEDESECSRCPRRGPCLMA
jgi:hypothetical protein